MDIDTSSHTFIPSLMLLETRVWRTGKEKLIYRRLFLDFILIICLTSWWLIQYCIKIR